MTKKRKLPGIIAILLILPFSALSIDDDQFTVIAGKQASYTDTVIIAHNEGTTKKNAYVDIHKIPSRTYSHNHQLRLKNNAAVPQVKQTLEHLWLQIPGTDFNDSIINQNGVTITSNTCQSREDQPQLTNGGIGYMLIHIMAQRALTARQAVQTAGNLIETYGFYHSGISYTIADSNEAWVLHAVKGKHWIAQRIPDDHAAVIANCYTIGKINLGDTKNFLGSRDIIRYAVRRGWYNPEKEERFHFAKAYAAPGIIMDKRNIVRLWRGINLLSKKKYKIDEPLPFAFPAKDEIKLNALFRVLRDHYEDTEYDLSNESKTGSPHNTEYLPICSGNTRYSFVAELRNIDETNPKEIAHRIWIALSQPDTNAYCPWYTSITPLPDGYGRGNPDTALQTHFNQTGPPLKFNPECAYCYYSKLSELVERDYKNNIKPVRKEWKNFENYIQKRLKKMEKEFQYLLKTNRIVALKIITNNIHKLEYRKWFLAAELIKKLEK